MPQLDKVTFYFQTISIILVFLSYHFYAIRYIIKPLYGNLKMRETCCWWADFDRDLTDWWLGEHKAFLQLTYSWSLHIINAVHKSFTTNSLLKESSTILYNDYADFTFSDSYTYFVTKYQLLRKIKEFLSIHYKV